jgi:hypothetical protein
MILANIQLLAKSLRCDACGYPGERDKPWYSIAARLPDCCPNRDCRSREWNGVKKKRKPAPKPKIEIELPKPRRMRSSDDIDIEF